MLPFETVFAAFPPSVRACGATLRPATLLHAVALESYGIDVERGADGADVWTAAWILSLEDPSVAVGIGKDAEASAKRFIESHGDGDFDELKKAVGRALGVAKATFIPGKPSKNAKTNLDGLPDGFGWPIEVAELIAHEHGIPFMEAMKIPCVTAFAILAMIRARNGGEFVGPDYYGRFRLKRQQEAVVRRSEKREMKTKEAEGHG